MSSINTNNVQVITLQPGESFTLPPDASFISSTDPTGLQSTCDNIPNTTNVCYEFRWEARTTGAVENIGYFKSLIISNTAYDLAVDGVYPSYNQADGADIITIASDGIKYGNVGAVSVKKAINKNVKFAISSKQCNDGWIGSFTRWYLTVSIPDVMGAPQLKIANHNDHSETDDYTYLYIVGESISNCAVVSNSSATNCF